ncbi:response regulator transcription factor [Marinobacterium sediminicola]|uniref:Response regulator receiver domain-containing protein n=1 Tax=Marinobacterium sediminicola TaxID=518898 RepID=A0ABY1S376_9GAMM|nr:response regulator [Marinobacterium sediminicola]ULG68197.1 response regulator [Marinobacterium sediminicola]SMR77724.1 Response regulator receiver domain-containing protein [Marinobacterium sediminicola]
MIKTSLSLLLVDDSRIARLSLKRQIQSLALDITLLEADSADSAEALLASNDTPDFALIDFNMPGRDGLELAERIKQSYPQVRMALVTANIQDALAQRAKEMGLAFLPKPTTAEQLGTFIQQD